MVTSLACVFARSEEPSGGPMQLAISQAWAKVAAMETNEPALSGFSKTKPKFSQDKKGLVKAEVNFAFNATPYGKAQIPTAVDKAKPYCYLIVSVWRPTNLPGQPVAPQRKYHVGTEDFEGYVTVFCSDARLAGEIRTIFESAMRTAEGKPTSEPSSPGYRREAAPQPEH
jgi:hypothetical protein